MIELKNVSAGYGKNMILNNVSAAFKEGKLTSVIGSNGCGKSTLLKTILDILPLYSGEIIIDGTIRSDMKRVEIARKAAYLAQGKSAPDMTVEQMVLHGRFPYLSYPRRYSKRDYEIAKESMEQARILKYAGKPIRTLSGGMRQNAYIAMALAQQTDYILLDEPTTFLDISHQLELMQTLRSLADSGKGIITVMHDLPMALTFSDRIILLNDGQIVCDDIPENVYKSGNIEKIFRVSPERMPDGGYCYNYETMKTHEKT